MTFENDKRNCLLKLNEFDKSRKGDLDPLLKEIITHLNSLPDYYTTSSCSGRIILLRIPESLKKHEFDWLYCSHELANFNDIKSAIDKAELTDEMIWLRMEGMILHVCCRTIEHANSLLKIARDLGLKRSGIISLDRRIIVEIESPTRADSLIANNGKILVSDDYLKEFTEEMNKRLHAEFDRIKIFEKDVKEKIL